MEPVQKPGSDDPRYGRLRAGEAHNSLQVELQRPDFLFKRLDGRFNGKHMIDQRLAQFGQAIAAGLALHQRQANGFLQFQQTAMDCRLVHAERLRGGQGASLPRYGNQVTQIIPVEHFFRYAILRGVLPVSLLPLSLHHL